MLKNTWVGERRLHANIAKFARDRDPKAIPGTQETTRKMARCNQAAFNGRSYAEVVEGWKSFEKETDSTSSDVGSEDFKEDRFLPELHVGTTTSPAPAYSNSVEVGTPKVSLKDVRRFSQNMAPSLRVLPAKNRSITPVIVDTGLNVSKEGMVDLG
ncbi:hypothetical protein OSB04_006178 [Centaurea solstitialis]|uniref:Uncharacterized protein n=1 Tax=Centaurea solstitialis TaxID=347529 RepID=A0AA38TQ02_9ASTR|nr:hypothetical protein OSB04_006178 [Centaurea solstitialis]